MKRLLCFFICLICVSMFTACNMTTKFFSKIQELYCIQWVDENNGIILRQAINYGCGYGIVTVDEVDYPIWFYFEDPNVSTHADCVIELKTQEGTFFANTENWITVKTDSLENPSLLCSIETSTIFGRKYEEIVLKKQTLEVTEFDAMEFCLNTRWEDDGERLSFSMSGGDINGSYSEGFHLGPQNGNRKVYFAWMPEKKFQIRDWDNEYVFAEGDYANEGLNAVLYFSKNEIWSGVKALSLHGEFLF